MSSSETLEIKAPDEFVNFPETYEKYIKKHENHNTTPEQGFIYFTSQRSEDKPPALAEAQ